LLNSKKIRPYRTITSPKIRPVIKAGIRHKEIYVKYYWEKQSVAIILEIGKDFYPPKKEGNIMKPT